MRARVRKLRGARFQKVSAAADTPCFLAAVLAFVCLFGRLNSNKIGDEGAKAIGEALATNQSLTSLEYAAPL